MATLIDDIPVQAVVSGLFGNDVQLVCDTIDRCGATTHYPFDKDAHKEELRQRLSSRWADPVKWLLGDPEVEDVRPQQFLWLDPTRCEMPLPSAPASSLSPIMDPFTFAITELVSVTTAAADFTNSNALTRAPAPATDFVRGTTRSVPFAFGGVAYPTTSASSSSGREALAMLDAGIGLHTTPPGFTQAVIFAEQGVASASVEDEMVYSLAATADVPAVRQRPRDINLESLFQLPDTENLLAEIPVTPEESPPIEEKVPIPEGKPVAPESQAVDTLLRTVPRPNKAAAAQLRREQRAALLAPAPGDTYSWAVTQPTDVSDFARLVPDPALVYPFELDNFQKQAIVQMERGQFVFVSAHTSAGKTVVAEYAIALSRRHMTRAIYTSPIKTLSNQKFRDFYQKFGEAGLLTGDAQVNPTSTVLIMTTEILRSMLYRGADLVRDVEWVIFDEVHYVNDPERGHVWEEVIIMLPPHVKMVMLSATVPNSTEFADWIGRTKQRKVYVISTAKRPVPLRYYLYHEGKQHEILVDGKFQSTAYRQLLERQREKEKKAPHLQYKSLPSKLRAEKQQWVKLVLYLKEKSLLPLVCFAFSKKRCEECCAALGNVDLNTKGEKSRIVTFMDNCLKSLKEMDRELPQIRRLRATAQRGIGVHHAGLLPLMKEIVEILFQQGLIKVLFATETFAMGVNMPARTVVFASIRKHDGREFRDLRTGEYIQMAGRAGRRGLDESGTVMISCFGETGLPEEPTLQHLLTGAATQLQSQFRLTYNMILNLLKMDHFRVEDMLRRSFGEARMARLVPMQRKALMDAKAKLATFPPIECIKGEPEIEDYHAMYRSLQSADSNVKTAMLRDNNAMKSLSVGRVVVVRTEKYGHTLGFIVKSVPPPGRAKILIGTTDSNDISSKWYQLVVLRTSRKLEVFVPTMSGLPPYQPDVFSLRPLGEAYEVCLTDFVSICRNRLSMPEEKGRGVKGSGPILPPWPVLLGMANDLVALWEKHGATGPEVMNPVRDFKMNSLDMVDLQTEKDLLLTRMQSHKCATCPKLPANFQEMQARSEVQKIIDNIAESLSDKNLSLVPEFDAKLQVLCRLGYINEDQNLELKGQVCGEIRSGNELLVTEVVFRGLLNPLTPMECAALLSCITGQDKSGGTQNLPEHLQPLQKVLLDLAEELGTLQAECGVDTDGQHFVEKALNFGMIEVAYEWAKGVSFAELCQLTSVLEGSLVRSLTQLDQVVREVRNAGRLLGDTELVAKMERTSELIKRDIVFAGSLYLHFTGSI